MSQINDESFYNAIGEEVSRENLVNQMIAYYTLKLEVGESKVTDFNEGSEIRNLLEAFAVDLYALMEEQNELTQVGFIDTAEGEYLDRHGLNPFVNLPRDEGKEATGYVTFTIPAASSNEISIPEGTIVVCSETGEEYETNGEALINVGETEVTVAITCLNVGIEGNCLAGAIDTVDDEFVSINGLTVSNDESLTDGEDYEEDDEYRERLLSYLRKDDFGSIGYYTELGNNVDGVHDVLLIDDTNNVYTKIVLVNGDVKPTPASVLTEVQEVFSDTQNIVINHSFSAQAPTSMYDTRDLTINLDVSATLDEAMLLNTLTVFFNGGVGEYYMTEYDGLSIGESVTKSQLYDVFYLLDGVETVEILEDGVEIEELSVASNKVLTLGTIDFNQTVTE